MFLFKFLHGVISHSLTRRRVSPRGSGRSQPVRRLVLEVLENRLCPSGGYLFVDSYNTSSVLRYDETTGAFVDEFVKKNSGGLHSSVDMLLGPDHNLYVSNGLFSNNNQPNDVLRYDGMTGASLGVFADSGQLHDPRAIGFGPDGNLYVVDQFDGLVLGQVVRYDGTTGAFLDVFVPPGSGGLRDPTFMLFGPDNNLYVIAGVGTNEVLRYDGKTGAFKDVFVTAGSGGLDGPVSMAFGPDGNLYVANTVIEDFAAAGSVLRYNGKTGAFLDTFIAPGSGGLLKPFSVVFGPHGNLFVGSAEEQTFLVVKPHTSSVLRYDGTTGAFLGTFVPPDSGGLRFPASLIFTQTDPVTRSFNRDPERTALSASAGLPQTHAAASTARAPDAETLNPHQSSPFVSEALARWQAGGVDSSWFHGIDVRIANSGGTTLGLASGYSIRLDNNAAGWGWFVEPTPWDDSEFTMPGNQGEMNRMDLLTVLAHEVGPLLGHDHAEDGVMADTLEPGIRRTFGSEDFANWSAIVDVVLSERLLRKRNP